VSGRKSRRNSFCEEDFNSNLFSDFELEIFRFCRETSRSVVKKFLVGFPEELPEVQIFNIKIKFSLLNFQQKSSGILNYFFRHVSQNCVPRVNLNILRKKREINKKTAVTIFFGG